MPSVVVGNARQGEETLAASPLDFVDLACMGSLDGFGIRRGHICGRDRDESGEKCMIASGFSQDCCAYRIDSMSSIELGSGSRNHDSSAPFAKDAAAPVKIGSRASIPVVSVKDPPALR